MRLNTFDIRCVNRVEDAVSVTEIVFFKYGVAVILSTRGFIRSKILPDLIEALVRA